MAYQAHHEQRRVAAVVAAYNEAGRIERVLETLTTYKSFDEIIVVDDGSTDGTAQAVSAFPVRLIRQPHNMGKGRAMDDGVAAADSEIIFFCDADVRGLTHDIIEQTIAPVRNSECDMMIAMRNRKIYYLSFILSIIPLLGGERALTRELWEQVPAYYKQNFMIEAALNFYARHYGRGFRYKAFPGLTQTIKEKKYGLFKGFKGRIGMFREVIASQVQLQLTAAPPHIQSGRIALANVIGALMGTALGAFMLLGGGVLAFLGATIVALNVFFIALNLKNLRFLLINPPRPQRLP